jgi:hypothetical protein
MATRWDNELFERAAQHRSFVLDGVMLPIGESPSACDRCDRGGVKGRRGDVVAAAFEALFSDPVGQGDSAGAENVVEVTLGNMMRGGDLGRTEMLVLQMFLRRVVRR